MELKEMVVDITTFDSNTVCFWSLMTRIWVNTYFTFSLGRAPAPTLKMFG